MAAEDCIFCKIIDGEIPADIIFDDDSCVAFNDISPQAPTHVLIVPREHIDSLDTASENQQESMGHLLLAAAKIARVRGFAKNGYRVVINTNSDGGQTVL